MTNFNLSNYLVKNKNKDRKMFPTVPRIYCNDGFSLSVQCNEGCYCSPREDWSDFYYQVEVGFPSEKPELIMQYAEEQDNPTKTVYGYVPIELVEQLILLHGGVK